VFLISNDENCILVDTSVKNQWGSLNKKINRLCAEKGIVLTSLVLTHSHFDHAGNAASIRDRFDAKVIVHRNEVDYLKKGKTSLPRGTIFLTKWFDIFGEKAAQLVKYKPANYDVLVDDKYDLSEAGFNAYIMHTPGHSEGSISIIIDNEIAVVGDAMFGVVKGSVLPFFADDTKSMVNSWKKLLETQCRQFLPSHGTVVSRELLQNQYNKYKTIYDL